MPLSPRGPIRRARAIKRMLAAAGVLALAVGGVTAATAAQTVTPAVAANGAFACDQNTLYAIDASGGVHSIDLTGTGAGVSQASTPAITTMTQNGNTANNALGVSPQGATAYAFENAANGGNHTLGIYDTATGTVTTIPNADTNTGPVQRGAVNPATGIYYFGGGTGSNTNRISAYDPAHNQLLPDVATLDLGGPSANGDIAFSTSGTMYVLNGSDIRRVDQTAPITANANTALTSTSIGTVTGNGAVTASNGIAFSTDGYLYTSQAVQTSGTVTDTYISKINPTTGSVLYQFEVTGSYYVDLATCNYPDTVAATASYPSTSSDQFTLTVTADNGDAFQTGSNVATSSPSSTSVAISPLLTTGGKSFTVTETGNNLGAYVTTWVCTDGGQPMSPTRSGSGTTATFTQPVSTTERSSNITCAFTNTLKAAAQDDAENANAGVTTNFADLTGNDTGSGISITRVDATSSKGATVTLKSDGTVDYLPPAGFSGSGTSADTFTYTITDTAGNTSTATVTVTVKPTAANDVATTTVNHAVTIDVIGNDHGTNLQVQSPVTPQHGSVTINGGSIDYTPTTGYSGQDTFGYTVKDSSNQTVSASVTVTVNPIANPDSTSTPSNTALTLNQSDLTGNDVGTGLTVTAVGPATSGTVTLGTDGKIHFTPATGFSGSVTFPYTISGGTGTSATSQVTVIVGPTATPDTGTVAAGQTLTVPAPGVLGNDTGTGLTASLATPPSHGTATVNSDGSYSYTPAAGFSGTDTFTYTATDPATGKTTTGLVTITVNPTAVNDTAHVDAGTTLTLSASNGLLANDLGTGLTVSTHATAAHGTLNIAQDGSLTYTPASGFSGTETISYTIVDSSGHTSTATLTIIVDPAANADTGHTIQNRPLTVNAAHGLLANDAGSTLTCALATPPAHGTVTVNPDGSYTYTPAQDFVGTDTFTYTVTDANGQTRTGTVTITVASPASAGTDKGLGLPNQPSTLDPLSGDTPSGGASWDPSTLALIDPATNQPAQTVTVAGQGVWTIASGKVTFTPEHGFTGIAKIQYRVTDTAGETVLGTLALTYPPELALTGAATVGTTLVASIVPTGIGVLLLLLRRRKQTGPRHRSAGAR